MILIERDKWTHNRLLRFNLDDVRLTSEESLDGYYLHHSIQTLIGLIRDGFEGPGGDLFAPKSTSSGPRTHGFSIRALDSRLFRGRVDAVAEPGEAPQPRQSSRPILHLLRPVLMHGICAAHLS